MLKQMTIRLAALALTLVGAGPAAAGVLLDLEDPPGQFDTPVTRTFVAGSDSTAITFAGYQVSGALDVANLDLTLTAGGPNLLGGAWAFTPAPFGSFASTFDDGTGVPALDFEGFIEDLFDTFSQTVATEIDQSYTLSFLVSNDLESPGPSELVVSAGDAAVAGAAVPEPSSLVVLVILFSLCGAIWTRSRAVPAT